MFKTNTELIMGKCIYGICFKNNMEGNKWR